LKQLRIILLLILLAMNAGATKRDVSILFIHYSVGSQMVSPEPAWSGKCTILDTLRYINENAPIVYNGDTAVISFRDYQMNSETTTGGLSDTDATSIDNCIPTRFEPFNYALNQGWARVTLSGQDGASSLLQENFDIPIAERDTMFYWRMFNQHNVPSYVGSTDSTLEQYDLVLIKQAYYHWGVPLFDSAKIVEYKTNWAKIVDSLTISNSTIRIGFLFGTPLYAAGTKSGARTDSADAHMNYPFAVWFRDSLMNHSNYDSTKNCWLFDSYTYMCDTSVDNTTRWGLATAYWLDGDPGSHLSSAGAELEFDSLTSFITQATMDILIQESGVGPTSYYVANPAPVTRGPKTYEYVSGASDANNGTSPSTPWETLDYATQNMGSGDTLYLMGGYWDEQISQDVLPWYMANLWIRKPGTYKAYIGSGCSELPTILGKQNNANTNFVDSMWIPGVMFRRVSNVTIDSLLIDSCGMAGIYFMGADNVTVTNCVITNIFQVPRRSTGDGQAFDETNTGGIYINAGTSSYGPTGDLNRFCLIRNNVISDILTPSGVSGTSTNHNPIHGRGLFKSVIDSCDLSHGYYGMRLKTDWDSNKVEYNYIHDNAHSGIAIGSGDVGNTFRFNVLRDNGAGIQLQMNAGDGGTDSTSRNWIYNNTVEQGSPQIVSWGIAFGINTAEMAAMQNNYVFNNLILGFSSGNFLAQGHLYHTPQAILDYNCYWSINSGENVVYSVSSSDQTMTLSSWTQAAPSEMGFNPDIHSVNANPYVDAHLALTDNSPQAVRTGGYGNINPAFPLYMGAFEPAAPASNPSSVINDSTHISGKVDIK
jgi:hypothetical protein